MFQKFAEALLKKIKKKTSSRRRHNRRAGSANLAADNQTSNRRSQAKKDIDDLRAINLKNFGVKTNA